MDESIEEVYRTYYRAGATDGLPVVPPTEERVEEMLRGTDLDPETELGRLGDREGILTVEKLATNAVMAGALPIHMPVLVAGARALSDPKSSMTEVSVGTDSSGHLYFLNGPIRTELDVNSGTGAFGPGFRSNATIGRALGLVLQNTADIHPGEQAMGVMGSPFKYSMVVGENEENTPWEPFHVEHGYDPEDSTITLTNPNCFVQSFPPQTGTQEVLSDMIYNTPPQMGFRAGAVYAISPFTAHDLGILEKDEVKEYIYRNAIAESHGFNAADESTFKPVEEQTGEDDSDAIPPVRNRIFDDPDEVKILVTGGEGKWNAVIGPLEGGPTTERIEYPENWDGLVEEYAPALEREWGKRPDWER